MNKILSQQFANAFKLVLKRVVPNFYSKKLRGKMDEHNQSLFASSTK